MPPEKQVGVGVGVVVHNKNGQVLVGKRMGNHAPHWSIFGGHLEMGETFEQCAIREIKEELGIDVSNPQIFGVSNNLHTYQAEGKHTISICISVEYNSENGAPRNMEPHKCEAITWVSPEDLPQPHFEASKNAIHMWMAGSFYTPNPQ